MRVSGSAVCGTAGLTWTTSFFLPDQLAERRDETSGLVVFNLVLLALGFGWRSALWAAFVTFFVAVSGLLATCRPAFPPLLFVSIPAPSLPPRIIAPDVHHAWADIRAELRPHLLRHWQVDAERHGNVVSYTSYVSPVGVQREDDRTPSGGPAGSDPAFLITDHIDR